MNDRTTDFWTQTALDLRAQTSECRTKQLEDMAPKVRSAVEFAIWLVGHQSVMVVPTIALPGRVHDIATLLDASPSSTRIITIENGTEI